MCITSIFNIFSIYSEDRSRFNLYILKFVSISFFNVHLLVSFIWQDKAVLLDNFQLTVVTVMTIEM